MRETRNHDRDRLLDEAIACGKFSEDRRAHYAALYDADPAGTEYWIDAMVAVPSLAAASAPYPRDLFPELVRAQGKEPVRGGLAPRTETPHVRPAGSAPAPAEVTPELARLWTDQLFPEAAAARVNVYPTVMSD